MDACELVRRLLMHFPSMRQDRRLSSGMPGENASRIVYLAVHDDPAVVFAVMLLDLLSRKLIPRSASLSCCFGDHVFRTRLHPPSVGGAGLYRVPKQDCRTATATGCTNTDGLYPYNVPAVFHHAHDVPVRFPRLRVLEHIESAHGITLGANQVRLLDVNVPVQ